MNLISVASLSVYLDQAEDRRQGFFYLDQQSKYNFITDTFITAGNTSDSVPYFARLAAQQKKFNFPVEAVALIAGYFTGHIYKILNE
ncbi:hypothetical protein ACSFXN_18090 [Planococcus sp. 1R117A]|uniref:hypothetical protein n=1 Tax=Planococcus sp. 1R117A TaxID=3447020 RepID=UPI003EDC8002